MKTNYGFIPDNEIKIAKIPDFPNIKLGNYASKLFDNVLDTDNSSIVACYNKNSFKLNELIKNKSHLALWPDYFTSRSSFHKVKLSQFINPKLAYFMGYFYADGSLKDIHRSKRITNKYEYKLKVGDEFFIQVEILRKLFKDLFNLDTKIRTERIEKNEHYYYVEITDKVLYRFITKIFGLPSGPKTGKLKMPHIILDCPKEIRKWFIRGVFDADGETRAFEYYQNKSLIKPRIRLHMKDELFISEVQKLLLSDFELKFNGPYIDKSNRAACIQIEKISEIKKAYQEKIFIHPIKNWRLEKLMGR